MALACLMGLAITVFVLYLIVSKTLAPSADADTTSTIYSGNSGTVATLGTATTQPGNTTTTAKRVTGSILVRPSTATASTSLTPTNIADFRPTNVLDGDSATAWVEGAKGTGAGQWVKFDFGQAISLMRIEISNGYQKDKDFFANYVRVKSLEIDYSDGSHQTVELQDAQGIQVIDPSENGTKPPQIQWIKFTILSVYPAYKFANAALSDIRVYEALR
jgi:hypothetical protein